MKKDKTNPKCFLDVTIGGNAVGRIVIELFVDTTPITAEKFRVLCTGEKGRDLHYKGSTFDNVVTGLCQGGKVKAKNMESVNGVDPEPENFIKKHDGPGTVSMLGPIRSEFFITTKSLPVFDGKYVLFGKVVEGIDAVNAIENLRSASGTPSSPIVIADCGEVREFTPNYQLASTYNKHVSSGLKEIVNANKQFALEPKDGCILENEQELVETADIFQRNLDILSDLKVEISSLEKRQIELLSLTKTAISIVRKRKFVLEMISCLSYDDLVNIEGMIKKKSDS